MWGELIEYLNPMDQEELKEDGQWYEKVSAGIKMPLVVLMRLTSPVVNAGVAGEGWCKAAALVQVTLAPVLLTWCVLLHGWPDLSAATVHIAYASSVVVGLLVAGVVHVTSSAHAPPSYHGWGFGMLGFITSTAWIYALAAELIHLLQVRS